MKESNKNVKGFNWLVISIILLGVILRIYCMVRTVITGDEGLFFIRTYTQHPPIGTGLYNLFNNIALFFGFDPRIILILLSGAGFFLVYLIGKKIHSETLGIFFALILSIAPSQVYVGKSGFLDSLLLLFQLIIILLFLGADVLSFKNRSKKYVVLAVLVFFVGTFLKVQAFVFLGGPLFIYGLYKHRLGIFKKASYWLLGISILPVLVYLFSNPEMASTILLFFYRANKVGFLGRLYQYFSVAYSIDGIIFILGILSVVFVLVNLRKFSKEFKDVIVFFLIYLVFFVLFVVNSYARLNYIQYTLVGFGFFIGAALTLLFDFKFKFSRNFSKHVVSALLLVLILFSINSVFLLVSFGRSDLLEDQYHDSEKNVFYSHLDDLNNLLGDEKEIVVGGNIGMDARYYVHRRLVWPSVVNSDKYETIKKGLIFYPIETNYIGNPAWDYSYLQHILNESIVLEEFKDYTGNKVAVIEIINHTKFQDSHVKDKGLDALGFLDGVV